MKKKLSLLMVALVAIAAFAVQQTRRSAGDVFSDDFSYATGSETFKGGSGSDWTGSIATIKIQSSNATHTDEAVQAAFAAFKAKWQTSDLSNAYYGDKCIKLGTSSSDGKMTTVALADLNGAAVVKISAAGWGSGTNKMKVAISGAGTISGEEVTVTNSEYTEYTYNISGGTSETKITISGHRIFIGSVEITTAAAPAVAAPSISGTTPFVGSTEVTLACETEGAAIRYTLDGNDPTAESTLYEAPFTLTETATVKAIAIKDEVSSSIASKTFTAIPPVADIATLNALGNDATFAFTGEALVVYQNGKYNYVKDNTGSSLIYGTSVVPADAVGKTIAANWTGKVSIYKNLFEAIPDAALTLKDGEAVVVTYPAVAIDDVKAENVNQVVTLKGVTYTALDGKKFNIKSGDAILAGFNQFGIEIAAPVEDETYDIVGAIGRYSDDIQFQPISITRVPKVLPVTVEAADITGGDITAALAAKATVITEAGDKVGNITINLAENGAYTVSASIEAGGNVVINGANGATIDASALTTPFILMSTTPAVEKVVVGEGDKAVNVYNIDGITIENVKIVGLPYQLIYANKVNYLMAKVSVANSIIAVNGKNKKTIFDFNGAGNTSLLEVTNSTIYANPKIATNGGFFSTQSGKNVADLGGTTQKYSITNSTLWNITNGNTLSTVRGNNLDYVTFEIKNNVIVDCGKKNETIKGFNGGGDGGNSTWDVDGNIINFTIDGKLTDTSANEKAGGKTENVKNSVAGIINFQDAAAGDFNVSLTLAPGTESAPESVGDPRWTLKLEMGYAIKAVNAEGITITPEVAYAAEGTKVYATYTVAEGYQLEQPDFVDDNGVAIEFAEGQIGLEKVGDVEKMFIIMPAKNVTIIAKANKLYNITLPTETTYGTVTLVKPAEGTQSAAGKTIKIKVDGLATGYKVVAKSGDTEITLNDGDHDAGYDYYFEMPEGDVTISIELATGINSIAADKMKDATIYTIGGQRVNSAQKGLYIINGKKVVIK